MTAENFCYWLNGLFEISDTNSLTDEQVKIIKEHLGLVFNKVTEKGFNSANSGTPIGYPLQYPKDSKEFYNKIFGGYTAVSC